MDSMMDEVLEVFLSEAREIVQGVDSCLLDFETCEDAAPKVDELFRGVHTIKGNAGVLGFDGLVSVLHAAEDLMQEVRAGTCPRSQALVDALLEANDLVGRCMDELERTQGKEPAWGELFQSVTLRLRSAEVRQPSPASAPAEPSDETPPRSGQGAPSEPRLGLPPALVRTGQARSADADVTTGLPHALGVAVTRSPPAPPSLQGGSALLDGVAPWLPREEPTVPLTQLPLPPNLPQGTMSLQPSGGLGSYGSMSPRSRAPWDEGAQASGSSRTLKVEHTKIDRLMNLVGEMVVAKDAFPYLANRVERVYGVPELSKEISAHYAVVNRIAEEMQETILQVRLMPVSFVLQRFPRLVRDLAKKLGKEVRLVLEGEETETDKGVVEALGDPLIHLVRNALDHGFETPDARVATGKDPCGRLVIRARQDTDQIVLELHDDGRGIDPKAIRQGAVAKGLLDEGAAERLSDLQALDLIFAAGFSTAETVSELSGRGVGMDVVRSAVERLQGSIALHSVVGQGTTVRLTLPARRAVTVVNKVMIVESQGQVFGVPMEVVVETLRVQRCAIHGVETSKMTLLRGKVLPIVSLCDWLGLETPAATRADDEVAVLVVGSERGEMVGLVVDAFRKATDVILKPLTGLLGSLPGYAGSALLGDGSVLLVLNPQVWMAPESPSPDRLAS